MYLPVSRNSFAFSKSLFCESLNWESSENQGMLFQSKIMPFPGSLWKPEEFGRHLYLPNSPVGCRLLSERGPWQSAFRDKDLRHLGRDKTCLLFHVTLSMQSSLGYPGGFGSLTLLINVNLVPRTNMLFPIIALFCDQVMQRDLARVKEHDS